MYVIQLENTILLELTEDISIYCKQIISYHIVQNAHRPTSLCMKWITREHAKVDRIACPWLMKNFVDKDAEFIFLPSDNVMEIAEGRLSPDQENLYLPK